MHTPLSILLKDKGAVVHHIASDASCYECALKMNQLGIGALLIMEDHQLQGIVSERDIIRKLFGHPIDPKQTKVKDIMTKDLITVTSTMTVQEAMRLVTDKRIRHLPVVDNGTLMGIISIGDLTRWVMLQQENEIAALTGYIHGSTDKQS